MKIQKIVSLLVIPLASLALSATASAAPIITVSGITGASSWLWFEAENATTLGTFGLGGATFIGNLSGNLNPGTTTGSYIQRDGGVSTFSYTSIPVIADMSNAQFYARYGSHFSGNYTPVVGGVSSGQLNLVGNGAFSSIPVSWSSATTVGSISAGNPTFSLTGNGSYNIAGYDGFYLASGALSAFGSLSGGWRQAPTFASVNTITAASLTPVISISGDAGGSTITLNGSAYVSGTPITTPGLYSLVIESYGASGSNRVLTGETFNLVIPEPSTWAMVLGGFGMLVGIRRRRQS